MWLYTCGCTYIKVRTCICSLHVLYYVTLPVSLSDGKENETGDHQTKIARSKKYKRDEKSKTKKKDSSKSKTDGRNKSKKGVSSSTPKSKGKCMWWQLWWSTHIWPSMHEPTIHHKTSKSSFLVHPLTELLLITTLYFFFPYDLLFSSYMTVSAVQLKMYISRNVHFQFRICTPFTNSPRTNRFVFDKYIQSLWTKLCQKVCSRG